MPPVGMARIVRMVEDRDTELLARHVGIVVHPVRRLAPRLLFRFLTRRVDDVPVPFLLLQPVRRRMANVPSLVSPNVTSRFAVSVMSKSTIRYAGSE